MKPFIIGLLLALSSSCASVEWRRANTNKEQRDNDSQSCFVQSQGFYPDSPFNHTDWREYDLCMRDRGYERVLKQEEPKANETASAFK